MFYTYKDENQPKVVFFHDPLLESTLSVLNYNIIKCLSAELIFFLINNSFYAGIGADIVYVKNPKFVNGKLDGDYIFNLSEEKKEYFN